MGGNPLRAALASALPLALVLLAGIGCGPPSPYINYTMPAVLFPVGEAGAPPTAAIELTAENSELFEGGIRVIHPELAASTPAFELLDHFGRIHTPQSLAGRVVWIDLWAEWCGTCRAEFPSIQRMHARYERNGFSVLAVCRNSTRAGFLAAIEKDWLTFPAVDASSDQAFPFPYAAFPTSIVIDRAGRVRAYWQGHRNLYAVERLVRALLAEERIAPEPARGIAPAHPVPTNFTAPPASESVISAHLALPRELPTGTLLEAELVLDLDPGWHLSAGREPGSIPVQVRFESSPEIEIYHWLPRAERMNVAGFVREVYSGRVRVPLWGIVPGELAPGAPLEVRVTTLAQACDATSCLAPSEIDLAGEIWLVSRSQ